MENRNLVKALQEARKREIALEAFGPKINNRDKTKRAEKYFYSKHNLEMAHDTRDPEVMLEQRYATATRFGFTPRTYMLTQLDKEQMRILDYADALLLSQKTRLLWALTNEGYNTALLETRWTVENVLGNQKVSLSFVRMVENFMRDLEAVKVVLRSIANSAKSARFACNWANNTIHEMDMLIWEMSDYYMAVTEQVNKNMSTVA